MQKPSNENPERETAVSAAQRSVEQARAGLEDRRRSEARREMGTWLTRMRETPALRGATRYLTALFLGIPLSAQAVEMERPAIPAGGAEVAAMIDVESPNPMPEEPAERVFEIGPDDEQARISFLAELQSEHEASVSNIERAATFEARYPETDRFYLAELARIANAIEGGQAAPEYYARVGRPEWTPYQRSLFSDATVQQRFTELHPEYRNLSAEDYLAAVPDMLQIASTEFRFSNQFRFIAQDATDIFASAVADMNPDDATSRYHDLAMAIGKTVGLAGVVRLTDAVSRKLPSDHPVMQRAEAFGIDDLRRLVVKSRDNIVHMDQARGQLRVMRRIGDDFVLIESFPAIGGPTNSPELDPSGRAGSEFVHVPDTVMSVSYVDRAKTSWSWQFSWVPMGAPIRESGDQLQYQHPATRQWYDLTGPNAGFFPDRDGRVIRPFDAHVEPMDAGLIRAATHSTPDGSATYVPRAWTMEQLIERNGGEIPTEWRWNDFGSMAIRLNTADGNRTNINIHSKPNEDPNDFLSGRTHGCLATYSEHVRSIVDTYGVGSGSTVVVTNKYDFDLSEML